MIALVLVSHSARLAEGLVELAAQMAPDVRIIPGAGTADGGIGTSIDVVQHAVEQGLVEADGVVILADLGSAVLTTESAIDLEDEWSGRVRLAAAPFVEGAVVAAVQAQQGGDLDAVVGAAESAGHEFAADAPAVPAPAAAGPTSDTDVVTATATVRNPLGLHARPAAQLARAVADLGVPVSIGGADGSSVLQLLALGATGGKQVEVTAQGPGADKAVATVVGLIESGFGEA